MSGLDPIGEKIKRAERGRNLHLETIEMYNRQKQEINNETLLLQIDRYINFEQRALDAANEKLKNYHELKKTIALTLNRILTEKGVPGVSKDIFDEVWEHYKKGGKKRKRKTKRKGGKKRTRKTKRKGGAPTKRTHKTHRQTPYDTTDKSNEQLINHLEKVIEENCGIKFDERTQEYKEGEMRGCGENLLSISHQLWINNGKQFPIEWYSTVLPLRSKGDTYNVNDNYYKLLRSVIFSLKNNVDKYSKEFLQYFFMQMEESSVTGIYRVEKGSGFDKFLKDNFKSYDGTISNSAINLFFLKELKGGKKRKTRRKKVI